MGHLRRSPGERGGLGGVRATKVPLADYRTLQISRNRHSVEASRSSYQKPPGKHPTYSHRFGRRAYIGCLHVETSI